MRVKLFLNINVFVAVFLLSSTLSAQTNTAYEESTFQFSLVPSLSTNGLHSSRYSNDVSFNILVGVSKNENVFTLSGLASIIRNNASGLQFAGLLNSVGNEGSRMTFAGLANLNFHNHKGMQFAGLYNQGKELNGVQFAGLCNNVKGDIKGIQIAGLVNKARNVSGVQVAGLVNIAENSDYPIGLINIIKNGEYGIAITHNEIGSTNITFRSGGKVMYGILGFGYNHKVEDNAFFSDNGLLAFINLSSFVTTSGIGAHINLLPWLRINNELSGNLIFDDSEDVTFMAGYSLMPAFRIGHIEIFGGPSINYLQTDNLKNNGMFPKKTIWEKFDTSRMQQIHFGYQFGVQYIF